MESAHNLATWPNDSHPAVTLSRAEVAQIAQESTKFAPGPLSQPEPEGGDPVGWGDALRAIAVPDAATQGTDSLGAAGGELLPCPFCGALPSEDDIRGEDPSGERYGYYSIECPNCRGGSNGRFCGVHGDLKEEARTTWNQRGIRTPDPAPAAARDELESLRKTLERLEEAKAILAESPDWKPAQERVRDAEAALGRENSKALDRMMTEMGFPATPPPSAPVARYGTPNNEFLALQGYITEENPGFVEFLRYAEGLANRYDAIRAEVDFWKTDADHWRKAFEEQRGGEAFITTQSSLVESRAEVTALRADTRVENTRRFREECEQLRAEVARLKDQAELLDLARQGAVQSAELQKKMADAAEVALATATARIAELENGLIAIRDQSPDEFMSFDDNDTFVFFAKETAKEILATRDGGTTEAQP